MWLMTPPPEHEAVPMPVIRARASSLFIVDPLLERHGAVGAV
jgi:hypothetical protein